MVRADGRKGESTRARKAKSGASPGSEADKSRIESLSSTPASSAPEKSESRGSLKRLVGAGFAVNEGKPTSPRASATSAELASNEAEPQPTTVVQTRLAEDKLRSNQERQLNLQARAALKDGLSKVLGISAANFDSMAASAFGSLKGGLKLVSELPDLDANELLVELDEKRTVLEFLCKLAKEKRMYCKQVQFALDVLLKEKVWQDTWQKSDDLRARVPANLRNNYEGEEESMAERLAREAKEELLALQASLPVEVKPSNEAIATATDLPTEAPPSSSQDIYRKPEETAPTSIAEKMSSTDVIAASSSAKVNSTLSTNSVPSTGETTPMPEQRQHGYAQLVAGAVASTPLVSTPLASALPAPRQRKRDKVKAFFRRSFMCFDRSDPDALSQ